MFAKMERAQMIVMTEVSNLFTGKKLWLRLWTGIRKAAAWYNAHMSLMHPATRGLSNRKLPTVVLMTDDVANRQKAERDNISSISGECISNVIDD